jgi:hypothetical protein
MSVLDQKVQYSLLELMNSKEAMVFTNMLTKMMIGKNILELESELQLTILEHLGL